MIDKETSRQVYERAKQALGGVNIPMILLDVRDGRAGYLDVYYLAAEVERLRGLVKEN